MPYFDKQASVYFCPRCNQHYAVGNTVCAVAHNPGTCCHYGETPCAPPEPVWNAPGGMGPINARKPGEASFWDRTAAGPSKAAR